MSVKKKQNIFLLGSAVGRYRSPSILYYFINAPEKYRVYYFDDNNGLNKPSGLFKKVSYYLARVTDVFLGYINRLFALTICDYVILLPMSYPSTRGLKFWLYLIERLNKKLIYDFYISFYEKFQIDENKNRLTDAAPSVEILNYKNIELKLFKLSFNTLFLAQSEALYYTRALQMDINNMKYSIVPIVVPERSGFAKLDYFQQNNAKIKICWWGSFLPLHGIDSIILMADILKKQGLDFSISLFGNVSDRANYHLEEIIKLQLQEEVKIYTDYTFDNGKLEPYLISDCDLALGGFGDSEKLKNVFLNKVADSFAMKIPVLTLKSSAHDDLLKNCMYTVENGNPSEMAAKVNQISSDKAQALRIADNGYNLFKKEFSFSAFSQKMASIMVN